MASPVQGTSFDSLPSESPLPSMYGTLIRRVQEKLVKPGVVEFQDTLLGFVVTIPAHHVEITVIEPMDDRHLIHVYLSGISVFPADVLEVFPLTHACDRTRLVKLYIPRDGEGRRILGEMAYNDHGRVIFKMRECCTVFLALEALVLAGTS
jgi:hypothetical protein